MRLSLRFIIPLLLALGVFAYAAVPLTDALMQRWFARDLDARSSMIASTVQEQLVALIATGSTPRIASFFLPDDAGRPALRRRRLPRPRSFADRDAQLPAEVTCASLGSDTGADDRVLKSPRGPLYLAVRAVDPEAAPGAKLVLVHDMSFVERRSEETRRYPVLFLHRARRLRRADHRRHRAAVVARLGRRHARAAARRRYPAAARR
jgi:trehalose 6-phosphate synthase